MVLELHVWGPAFGLPSVDPESIAIITYFAHAVPQSEWVLLASSPSVIPSQVLPALRDSSTNKWISGFRPIVAYIKLLSSSYDLDRDLSPGQRADSTAYTAFLTTHAAPLLALSLYVSSANWSATTRPAYSTIIPFPLTWTEPLRVRSAMAEKAAHLGLSSLDTDLDLTDTTSDDGASLFSLPRRLRRPRLGVSNALTPEQKARIRLEDTTRGCLDVLATLKNEKDHLLSERGPTSLDCLAFGYLALMLISEVPRPWLRDVMTIQYSELCKFIDYTKTTVFEGKVLPWVDDPTASSVMGVSFRFLADMTQSLPGVGEDFQRWIARRLKDRGDDQSEENGTRHLIIGVGAAITCSALIAGAIWYRNLPRFGSPLYRYERVRNPFLGLGSASAMFDISADWRPGGSSSAGSREPRAFTGSTSVSSGFEDVSIEIGGKAPVAGLDVSVSDVD